MDYYALMSLGTYNDTTQSYSTDQDLELFISHGWLTSFPKASGWVGRYIGNLYLNSKLFMPKLVELL